MAIRSGGGRVAAKLSSGNSFVDVVPFAGCWLMVQKDGDVCVRVGRSGTC